MKPESVMVRQAHITKEKRIEAWATEFATKYEPCKKGKWMLFKVKRRKIKVFFEHMGKCEKCMNHGVGQLVLVDHYNINYIPPILKEKWKM